MHSFYKFHNHTFSPLKPLQPVKPALFTLKYLLILLAIHFSIEEMLERHVITKEPTVFPEICFKLILKCMIPLEQLPAWSCFFMGYKRRKQLDVVCFFTWDYIIKLFL